MIKTFDRTNLQALRGELNAAVSAIAERHGIAIQCGRCGFSPENATLKLELSVKTPEGAVVSRERKDYTDFAEVYGLDPAWLDKTFVTGGETYKITGLRPKGRKRPVLCQQLANGKTFVFPVDAVKAYMKVQSLNDAAAANAKAPRA